MHHAGSDDESKQQKKKKNPNTIHADLRKGMCVLLQSLVKSKHLILGSLLLFDRLRAQTHIQSSQQDPRRKHFCDINTTDSATEGRLTSMVCDWASSILSAEVRSISLSCLV